MLKKLHMIAALLLLVSVQALSVNCDLRCSLMGVSKYGHALHAGMQMAHCHGMSIEQREQTSVAANDCCSTTGCGIPLHAIFKSTAQDADGSSIPLLSAAASLADPFGNSNSNHPSAFLSLSRSSDSEPLAQRPGISLRI